jgi:hypothetical protein
MDRQIVEAHAQATCDALMAGDVETATADFSPELKSNLGQLVALFPLPLTEASVESLEQTGKGYVAVLRVAGENDVVRLQTRWKERDGHPTVVEASHVAEQIDPSISPNELPEDLGGEASQ